MSDDAKNRKVREKKARAAHVVAKWRIVSIMNEMIKNRQGFATVHCGDESIEAVIIK